MLLCEYTLVLVLVIEVAHASSHLILVQGDVVMPGQAVDPGTLDRSIKGVLRSPVGSLVDWIPPYSAGHPKTLPRALQSAYAAVK